MTRKFTFLLMALLALAGFKSWGQETILSEPFEHDGSFPEGWTATHNTNNGVGWTCTTGNSSIGNGHGNTGYAVFCQGSNSKLTDYLTTTAIDFSGYSLINMSFYFINRDYWGDINELIVEYSASADGPWTSLWSNTSGTGTIQNSWTAANVDLSALGGGTYYLRFVDVDKYGYGVSIDDIVITGSNPQTYNITYDNTVQHGTISGPAAAAATATVTLTATPDENYALEHFIVNGLPIEGNTFIMPENDVTVSATFVPHYTLTVNDGTNTNSYVPIYGFYADATCKSQFIIPASALGDMLGGTVSDMTFYLNSSSSISFTGTWDVYVKEVDNTTLSGFVSWSELGSAVYHGNMTITNGQLTVNFTAPITYNGNNLLIGFNETASGNCPSTSWLGVSQSSNTAWYSTYNGAGNPQQFLPKTTFSYVPNPNLHHITVTQPAEGGTISAPATAISGTTVTLTATPELGYAFGEWTTDPEVEIVDNQFEMPESDITVTATFTPVESYAISFNLGEYEGLVDVAAKYNDETITGAPEGTEVTLEYTNLNEGYTFGNWTLNGEALAGNTFTMPAEAVEVGVVLNERPRFAVTIDEAITNGTITAEPSSEILGGTLVTLTITPETGYTLDVLTVTDAESNPVAVTNNTFTMPESNVTVTATFVHGITVYDGTNTNDQVPVYGTYADSDYKSQFIFPAEDLEAMAGGIINSMTFYASEEYVAIPGTWSVYVSEVENTTLSGLEDWANLDAVLEGATITISGHQMTVNFATPFLYNGGNLLIGFNETISGSYKSTNWYGVPQTTNTAYYWYDYSGVSEGPIQFLPKTTFLYTPVTPYTVNLHVNGVVSEEEVSILPTPENIPAGMTFCGWTSSDIATYTTEAPSYVTKATADGEDFYAVFSYTEEEQTRGQNWVKITSPSELVDGEEIVLIYNDNYVMGQRSSFGTNYNRYAVEVVDGRIASMPSEANVFTLSGTSGNWKLNYSDSEVGNTTLSYNTNDCLAYYGLWQSYGCDSYDVWTAEGTSKVIFRNNYNYEYIGEDESEYAELIHSVSNANLACQAFKKDVALVTYYMTEVLTSGEVTDLTTNNIIVASPITVSGRLEMNEGGLFRNENTANFVFADGAQFYYTGTETVMATFQKNITGYTGDNDNYYLIANPTDEDEVTNLTENDYDLFTFNPDAALEWKNQQDNAVIEQGTGYLYANSEDVTLQFAGELMPAGEAALTLVKAADGTGLDYPGFNLVGNPFACDAYIDGSFYRMNGTEFVSVANGPISPCEGIFVEASEDGEELAITTTAASKGANLELTLSQGRSAVIDRAIVRFDESNDMHKFMMNPAHTNIRLAKNGQEFAAVSSEAEGEIPVSFMAEKDGSYTISVNTENVNAHYIHLIDNKTGMDTDLLATPSYTFNASTNDYAYRFKLVFNVEIGEANGNDGDNDNFAFMSNGNLVIDNIEGEAVLQIVDVLGRVLSTEIVSGSYNKALNLKAGLYILNLNGMTQKIVVE